MDAIDEQPKKYGWHLLYPPKYSKQFLYKMADGTLQWVHVVSLNNEVCPITGPTEHFICRGQVISYVKTL